MFVGAVLVAFMSLPCVARAECFLDNEESRDDCVRLILSHDEYLRARLEVIGVAVPVLSGRTEADLSSKALEELRLMVQEQRGDKY